MPAQQGVTHATRTIERIDPASLSPAEFHARFVATRTPVVFSALPSRGPNAASNHPKNPNPWDWLDIDALARSAPDAVVSVESSDPLSGHFGSARARMRMPFPEFVSLLRSGRHDLYLTTQYKPPHAPSAPSSNMNSGPNSTDKDCDSTEEETNTEPDTLSSNDSDDAPPFEAADYAAPPLDSLLPLGIPTTLALFGNLTPHLMNLWIGATSNPNGTSSGLHHDFHDNFYLVHAGRKRFTIFSPKDTPYMYLNGDVIHVHPNGLQEYRTEDHARHPHLSSLVRADGAFLEDVAAYKLQIAQTALDEAITDEQVEAAELALDDAMAGMLQFQSNDESEEEENDEEDSGQLVPFSDRPKRKAVNDAHVNHCDDTGTTKRSKTDETVCDSVSAVTTMTEDVGGHVGESRRDEPPSFSRVDLASLDNADVASKRFPLLSRATRMTFDLAAGEALYLPAGWFHEVRSFGSGSNHNGDGDHVHVALNYWLEPPTTGDFAAPYPDAYWNDMRWKPLSKVVAAAATSTSV